MRSRKRVTAWLCLALFAVGSAGSFWLGVEITRRWPLESLERVLGPSRSDWRVVTTVPTWGHESAAIRVGSQLYIFGGFAERNLVARSESFVFDLTTRSWRDLPDLPQALTHAQPALRGGRLWFAGGQLDSTRGPVTANVWSFDLIQESWRQEPSLPEPRAGGSLFSVADTLHFMGGFDVNMDMARDEHWVLNPGSRAWTAAPGLPGPRGHHSGVKLGRELWIIGGVDSHENQTQDLPSVFVYDLHARRWSLGPSLPFGLSHNEATSFAEGQRIYVVGGRALGRTGQGSSAILTLDRSAMEWGYRGSLPNELLGGVAAIWSDTLFAGLGAIRVPWDYETDLNSRPLSGQWFSVEPMPTELGEIAAGVIDRRLYVVGEGSNQTQSFDLRSGTWNPNGELSRRPLGGHHHTAEVMDGRLFLLGGLGGTVNNAAGSVQIYEPASDTWTYGPRMPYPGGSVASAMIGGQIYVAGGIVGDTTTRQAAVLDVSTMTWSRIADMPLGRNHTAAGTDGERFFVFGGRGPGSGDGNVVANGFADVQVFDPRTGTWESSPAATSAPPSLPVGRGGMGKAAFIDGEFWVIGGETRSGEGATADGTYARVDIYNAADERWRRGADLNVARHGIFPVVEDGRIIVAGGGTQAGYSASSVIEIIWPN